MTTPKVSVLMITYNHEKFIAQAIESVLMQEVSFEYEFVIGEDCSSDKTREIVIDYQKKHSDKIRLLLPEKNLGIQKNFAQVLSACKGQYIAFLEGDDYWIFPTKLQKQVDLLEGNPQISGCFSNAIVVDDDGNLVSENYFEYGKLKVKQEIRTEDIIPFGISPANTIFFRRNVMIDAPNWFTRNMRHSGVDLLITLHGIYYHINETLGAYRIHSGGSWSPLPLSQRLLADLIFLKPMYHDEHMHRNYEPIIRKEIKNNIKRLYKCKAQGESYFQIAKSLVKFLLAYPRSLTLFNLVMGYTLNYCLGRQV
jgi:glycosyltransferase involved in cell wall biosynthesis